MLYSAGTLKNHHNNYHQDRSRKKNTLMMNWYIVGQYTKWNKVVMTVKHRPAVHVTFLKSGQISDSNIVQEQPGYHFGMIPLNFGIRHKHNHCVSI